MAHRIKGAAGHVSAVRLARTAANLESDCKTGASAHPPALVEALAHQCAELRATMEKWMKPGTQ
jgi:HPt (histidine-containing phosphotransfer) domain-containing protein